MRDMTHAARTREINDTIRYTMWSVFRLATPYGTDPDNGSGVTPRPPRWPTCSTSSPPTTWSCAGSTSSAVCAPTPTCWSGGTPSTSRSLQDAYQRLRRTAFGARLEPVWSQVALHRPAEFNKSHVPAFLADEEPRAYVCVYPFVRSYDWYLLDETERRAMLSEHGQMARGYPDVRANTVASFALGDYEWILAFEADELHRIVDLMRHLRASRARLHVREEVPFYTGPRVAPADLVQRLP